MWRRLTPQVIIAVVRRYGDFGAAEDAVQEALLAAATQWPGQGIPDDPKAWLITVASRRLIDRRRSEGARQRREIASATTTPADEWITAAPGVGSPDGMEDKDDTLLLLLLCCHPSLTPASQVALTLRAVGGLTTAQVARAFLVPESTMGQRISRAKQTIRDSGGGFEEPTADNLAERLRAVLHTLYLIFNEGYTTSGGDHLQDVGLAREAIRLARTMHQERPDDGEVGGLLALMILTDARRAARSTTDGSLVPLADQDRQLWDAEAIAEGVALVTRSLSHNAIGPFQIQAAVAAVHVEAVTAADTDWPQIVALYDVLERLAPNPVVTLNHAVALAMAQGPERGLALLSTVEGDKRLAGSHRLYAVRAHLLEMAGDRSGAHADYERAARLTTSVPEQRYLTGRADRTA
ncbi:MAG: sigma-70 family RNA polymerase sigma factor [Lapillicoccus sp.]